MSSCGVMEVKLELLEEEALGVVQALKQLSVVDASQNFNTEDEILSAFQNLKKECIRISEVWNALRANGEADDMFAQLAPTAGTTTELIKELDRLEIRYWDTRIRTSREEGSLMRQESMFELRELEQEQSRAVEFNSVSLLAPEMPTQPGTGSHTGLSLQSCLKELEEELTGASDVEDALTCDVEPASVRALHVLDTQLQLQMDCRRLEGKFLENEDDDSAIAIGRELVVDTTSSLAQELNNIVFARTKFHAALQLTPHPRSYSESEAARGALQKEIGSRNAQEGFRGYVKDTMSKLAQLKGVAGMEFEVVAGAEYTLGCPDASQRFSVYPVAGSVDHEARLDRRTMYWLLSTASQKKAGLEYVDGPLHYIYSGRSRTQSLHAYYVQKCPMTLGQVLRLMEDRRFASLKDMIPSMYLQRLVMPRFTPTFLNREVVGFRMTEEPRRGDKGGADAADQDVLEVPYFVAERIATLLGGVVCPFDVWEAGGRGVEKDPRRGFLFSDVEAHKKLKVHRKGWCVEVETDKEYNVKRSTFGESIKLLDASVAALESIRTPYRLERYGRLGCEWNSTLQSTKDRTDKKSITGPEWSHASTPSHLSILEPATNEGDDMQSDLSMSMSYSGSDASAAPASTWAPLTCDFVPTSHVLRSVADYGTQDIVEGTTSSELSDGMTFEQDETFDPRNDRSFIGTALYTFGLPHRGLGGPIAAFRLAFPVFSDGHEALASSREEQDKLTGVHLNWIDLLSGLGKQRRKIEAFQNLLFCDSFVDPLYRSATYRFPPAGFDLTFAPEIPNVLASIDVFAFHVLMRPQIIERDTYRHPIATDHVVPFTLPLSQSELLILKASVSQAVATSGNVVRIVVDNAMELSYEDTVTLPESTPQASDASGSQKKKRSRPHHGFLGPRVLKVCMTWRIATLVGDTFESVTIVPRCTVRLLQ